MHLVKPDLLELETDKVIDEIIDCWMGHKSRNESDVWNCFYRWVQEVAEQQIQENTTPIR